MHSYFSRAACIACISCLALGTTAISLANVLVNPGFETGAVFGAAPVAGAFGWDRAGTAETASINGDPAHSGMGSLKMTSSFNLDVPNVFQAFAASPGQTWDFQGYMLAPDAISGATFGLLKIVWSDGTNDLATGVIHIGLEDPSVFPGIDAQPFLDLHSTPGEWQFAQAQGVAPAGTTEVKFFALYVGLSDVPSVAYFDDLQASRIPEPGSLALLLAGMLALPLVRKRRA